MPPLLDVDALTKLVGVVLSGFGAVRCFEPWNKRRLAHATADEMKTLARAEIDVQKIRLEGQQELQDLAAALSAKSAAPESLEAELVLHNESAPLLPARVHERIEYQEAKRQLNVEQVALQAANRLRGRQASAEPVDEDWVARFFESAKDVSSEQMQELWGKILAGEVVRPGSFSLRCIEAVKNLSKDEATLFEDLSPYVVNEHYVLRSIGGFDACKSSKLNEAMRLAEAGLLAIEAGLAVHITLTAGESETLAMSDFEMVVTSDVLKDEAFSAYILTCVGKELMCLFNSPADRTYARNLVNELRRLGYRVDTRTGTRTADGLTVTGLTDLFPPEPPTAESA